MKTKRLLFVIITLFFVIIILVRGIKADNESSKCAELSRVMNDLIIIKKQINVQTGITKQDIELIRASMGKMSAIFNRARAGSSTPVNLKHSANDGLRTIEKINKYIKKKKGNRVMAGIERLYKIMAMFRDYAECDE